MLCGTSPQDNALPHWQFAVNACLSHVFLAPVRSACSSCWGNPPPNKEIRLLLQAGLSATIQLHLLEPGKSAAALIAVSMKVSDNLKQLKATTDSFLTFTRKLYTLALLPEKSADKPLTKQLELLQRLPYKNLAYNGNKIDKNVIASAKSVIKRADPDAVSSLTRLTHVAAWFLAACHSMLRRKFATAHEMTDDVTEKYSRISFCLHEIFQSIVFIVSALAKSVCTPDFQKVLGDRAREGHHPGQLGSVSVHYRAGARTGACP